MSKRWPKTTATVQNGALGSIYFGRGASAPACFFGYAYAVDGIRCAGFFALYGEDGKVNAAQTRLAGSTFNIGYNPNNPDISCLIDSYDPRFEGLAVTQNPEWIDQAPAFDLGDAIRKSGDAHPLEIGHSKEQSASTSEMTSPLDGFIVESSRGKIRMLWTCAVVYFVAMLFAFRYAAWVPYQLLTLAGAANMTIIVSFVVLLKKAYKRRT